GAAALLPEPPVPRGADLGRSDGLPGVRAGLGRAGRRGAPAEAPRPGQRGRAATAGPARRRLCRPNHSPHPTGAARAIFQSERFPGGLALSPDGRRLVVPGDENPVPIWDVPPDGKRGVSALRFTLRGHPRQVWGVAFSPDGRWVASG